MFKGSSMLCNLCQDFIPFYGGIIFHLPIETTFCLVIHPLMDPGEFLCAGEKKLNGHL